MGKVFVTVKKIAILCHRWMGVAFCPLFAWWFLSGIFMMYWDYPAISREDRLERAESIDPSTIRLSPAEAWAKSGQEGSPGGVVLAAFDGRPVYRFGRNGSGGRGGASLMVYADDGTVQSGYSGDVLLRIVAHWTGQSAPVATVTEVSQADQWSIQIRNRLPLLKYSFPDGQQVYVARNTGEILQYTTTASRIGAHLGPIPHWIYYTPLRIQQKFWSNVVIYASGVATIAALLGLIVGLWMYSPSKKYQLAGEPASVPYSGQKRLHMILGLFFGIVTCTWAFSGMLSMDPPFLADRRPGSAGGPPGGGEASVTERIQAALRPGRFDLPAYESKPPLQALAELGNIPVKELQFTSFDNEPIYMAFLGPKRTRIVPAHGEVKSSFDVDRITSLVASAAQPVTVAEKRLLIEYDAYYIDRRRQRPLPVVFVRLNDEKHTQLYIDQRTGQLVGEHSDASSFTTRWLYHGLHSLDFPWLYNYRPTWDIVVLTLMTGGLWLCVTAIVIAWQVLRRKFARRAAAPTG